MARESVVFLLLQVGLFDDSQQIDDQPDGRAPSVAQFPDDTILAVLEQHIGTSKKISGALFSGQFKRLLRER